MNPAPRLILLHQQATSGRLRFLCLASGVLLFGPLPADATLREADYSPPLRVHPAALVGRAEVQLGLRPGSLIALAEFHAWAATADGDVAILLAAFTAIDPPFAAVERSGARFIAITEARRLSELERALLRRAYEHALG